MTNSRATSPKAWRKRVGGIELDLPSGNVCLVKRPGMDALLKAGIMPDSLTPIAMEHIRKAESGGRPLTEAEREQQDKDMEQKLMEVVMSDPGQMSEMFRAYDRVVAMCVVEPKVELHFKQKFDSHGNPLKDADGNKVYEDITPEERYSSDHDPAHPFYVAEDLEPLYTDEVDPDDKTFIFQYVVGGSSDIEQFRGEQAAAVASPPVG